MGQFVVDSLDGVASLNCLKSHDEPGIALFAGGRVRLSIDGRGIVSTERRQHSGVC